MTTARCIQRTIDNLRATIAHHEHQYRILLEPEITDTQFDALKVQLAGLLATHPQYALSAPLPAVGSDRTESRPIVAHRHPMLSLDATSDLAKVLATFAPYLKAPTLGVSIEPKLDGLALSLRYVDGQLVAAAIRGDGTVGEDVIGNATVIATIPQRLTSDAEGEIEVRGEVVVYRAVFNAYNEQAIDTGKRTYTNPRSMAAAAMRLQDPAMAQKLGAHFIAYEAYGITQADPANTYERVPVNTRLIHDQLTQWGFDVVPAAYIHVPSNIEAEITRIEHVREQYPYDIDGAVIKLIDPLLRELLGSTSAHPRWAMAYKYPAQEAFTTITAVVFQTGRTGAITPVVKVEPTPLGGTTVRSVTLHNPATLTRMALRIGDTAVIRRANDVIPYFVKKPYLVARGRSYRRPRAVTAATRRS